MVEGVMHAASGHHFLDELDAVVLLFPLFCVCSPLVKHASKLLVFFHCDSVVYDPPEVGLVAMIECPCSDDSFLLVQLELSLALLRICLVPPLPEQVVFPLFEDKPRPPATVLPP